MFPVAPVVTVFGPSADEPVPVPDSRADAAAPPAPEPSTGPSPAAFARVANRAEPAGGWPQAEPGAVPHPPRPAPSPVVPQAPVVPRAPVVPQAPAAPVSVVPVRMEDRASTAAEQREFVAALGPAYTETLGAVNAALSTWPALRDDSPGARADYAAVCVYLGRGGWGAVRLNAALRAGRAPDLDGYLPCLVSGMRRLPRHRRAVLCQARLVGPVERSYPVGAVLTEPAFRSASARLDVAVPGADLDLLIWSRSALQTSVLAPPDRLLDEATFLGGTRFKVLEVRRSEPGSGDGATLPPTAVLLREVLPGERAGSNGLDEADRVALGRLTRALAQRQGQDPHAVEDVDLVERLAGPALGIAGAAVAYP